MGHICAEKSYFWCRMHAPGAPNLRVELKCGQAQAHLGWRPSFSLPPAILPTQCTDTARPNDLPRWRSLP